MLLELAVGDAYGAGFEYADRRLIEERNDLTCYVKHPRHGMLPGSYTDDTQMSIAVAEAIVSGEPWTPGLLADRFVAAFRRDPREGYAGRFYDFLRRMEDGAQFLREIVPVSDKSGAAMRAAPVGVFGSVDEVLEKCAVQAAVTHDTDDGIHAAQAAALMTHYFLYDLGPKAELGAFLEAHVPGRWAEPRRGKVGSKGWMSVRAAVTVVLEHDRLSAILQNSVAFGGDVDTVASIALAAASCSPEVAQDLPENLTVLLENGAYGRDYLADLDARLLALVSLPPTEE